MTTSSVTPESNPTSADSGTVAVHDDLAAVAATAPIEGGVGDYFRTYVQRVRSGDMGSLPAVAGLIVLVVVFWILHPQLRLAGQLLRPAQAVLADHLHRDGAGLRAAARRDRPGRGHRGRRLRHPDGPAVGRLRLAVAGRDRRRAGVRPGDRDGHRLAVRQGAHPVLRGDPGAVPRLPGRVAVLRAERQGRARQHLHQRQLHHQPLQRPDVGLAGLAAGRGGRGRLRPDQAAAGDLAQPGRADRRAGRAGRAEGDRRWPWCWPSRCTC